VGSKAAEEKIIEPGKTGDPLGQRLRARRRELSLTLKEVADAAGLSVGFISQVERGLTVPSLSSLASIAGVLGSHVTTFLAQPEGKTHPIRGTMNARSMRSTRLR